MDKEEIINYIETGSQSSICIHRQTIEGLDLFVVSIYITGSKSSYCVNIEFDPITLVDQGEGWVWQSGGMVLEKIVNLLEAYKGIDLDGWENFNRTGNMLDFYDEIDGDIYIKQQEKFINEFEQGKVFLPCGFDWKVKGGTY